MSNLWSGFFWGVVIILIGIFIVINALLGTRIPIIKILLGIFFLYLGIKIILGSSLCGYRKSTCIFHKETIRDANNEYNVVFGERTIDLTDVKLEAGVKKIEVNIAFGNVKIKINQTSPIKIKADVAFGSAHFPDGETVGFGQYYYHTESYRENETVTYLFLKLNVAFGTAKVIAQ
jgi:predicted membrane protein